MSKICSCFGQNKIKTDDGLEQSVRVVCEHLILKEKFDVFCFGGMGQFDELCLRVVQKLKQTFKNIKTVLVEPNTKHGECKFNPKQSQNFDKCISFKPDEKYCKFPVLSRNFEMAKSSEFVLFYASESGKGGATKILNFAKETNIPHINFLK